MKSLRFIITLSILFIPRAYAEIWTNYTMMLNNYAGETIEGGMWGWESISGQPSNIRGIRYGVAQNWPNLATDLEVLELQKDTLNTWCNNRWIRLRGGFSNWAGQGIVFAEYRMQTEIFYNADNPNGINITTECGGSGEHYALQTIPNSPYWIKAWGAVYINGVKQFDFFHYHKWSPPTAYNNQYWQGGGSSTRNAILEEENWWDSWNGWNLNGEQMPQGSMGVNGKPNGVTVPIARREYIAYQTGRQWYTETPSINWATWLFSSWPY